MRMKQLYPLPSSFSDNERWYLVWFIYFHHNEFNDARLQDNSAEHEGRNSQFLNPYSGSESSLTVPKRRLRWKGLVASQNKMPS
jgi:hypothetical protein